jgi:TldD protein
VLSEEELGTTITIPPVTDTSLIEPDVLQNVLSAALSHGGDMAEVFAEDSTTASAMLDDRRIEELSSGRSRGAGIRVVDGETTGFAHTSDLSEAGLLAAAAAAASVAREGGGKVRTVELGTQVHQAGPARPG